MKKRYLLFTLFAITGLNAQVINFPDAVFKARLVQASSSNQTAADINGNPITIDTNSNGEIEVSEALLVVSLSLEYQAPSSITSLVGIQSFPNLNYLFCAGQQITSVDLSGMVSLDEVNMPGNHLQNINLNGLTNLTFLEVTDNNLSSLNLTGLVSLYRLECSHNNITGMQIMNLPHLFKVVIWDNDMINFTASNLPDLELLQIQYNSLQTLTLSNLPKLWDLEVQGNLLTTIDFSNMHMNGDNSVGIYFDGSDNQFISLDFSGAKFRSKILNNNQLEFLGLKDFYFYDGESFTSELQFNNNPNLHFICVNDETPLEADYVQDLLDLYGYTNCVINGYCSFVPGGDYYTISGTNTLDANNNNCDINDASYPNMKFAITSGTYAGAIVSNSLGNYQIAVPEGAYTITPIIENPSYFSISPPNFQVAFPGQLSPYSQNFCIAPNGIHNDLEVTIIPLLPPRPGFDTPYKIKYKNKGTAMQSGTVVFTFEDDKMDLVVASPNFTSQSANAIAWNYTNLLPLESREISLILNVNSPTETPAVTIGDQLAFTVEINPLTGDENLYDNAHSLEQAVVGSYDPNDKTCTEGSVVGPNVIGEFVHYVIRFENTGTYPAENIVVKDMIDLAKFDLNTLVPISSSHTFVTRIAPDGKVEFIFENINLPFNDANNDGYVAFKIKTKSTLVVGDTFTNIASIYFDYNFPVVTDPATTTIQVLANNDFEFDSYFVLYPNPVENSLNIKARNNAVLSSISIYNMLGQLLLVEANPNENIDISNLKKGNYIVKVLSEKGIATAKFSKL